MMKSWSFGANAVALVFLSWWVVSCGTTDSTRVAPVLPARPVAKPSTAPVSVPARREIRAVWVSETTHLDWDRATAALQRAGFNTMYVNLASGGAALYPGSKVLPSLTGKDDVGRGIAMAHQRGIAVHAKVIVSLMFKAPASLQQRFVRERRVMRGPKGQVVEQFGQAWLCPSEKANRDLVASAVREIVTRYPVDGVQLDYIRFCEQPSCYCPNCRREFESWLGKGLKAWPAEVTSGAYASRFNEWKQGVINDWARQLAEEARRGRPGVTVSAAVFPDLNRAKEEKAQNWRLWLERGWMDYVCTMTYTASATDFEARVRAQQAAAPKERLVVGLAGWKLKTINEVAAQIELTRRYGAPGFALFSYDDCAARNFLPNLAGSR